MTALGVLSRMEMDRAKRFTLRRKSVPLGRQRRRRPRRRRRQRHRKIH